ncbi:MAG: hypothetical protein IPL61_31040 [Myxococcales bacterium]|nr:hypothetical protein [Myxococcales bacterium]
MARLIRSGSTVGPPAGARSDWQEARDAGFDGSHDLIWCSDDPRWVVYWDAQEDVCVCGTAGDRCLPWDVEIFWLPALGALEPDGFPALHPSARSQEMHQSYGATMLPLCAADELVLRVLECCASIGGGIESVGKLRTLASYLRYGRLLSPPLAGVRAVLELVDECSFVPEPRNRALWSEAVLSEIDERTCDVLRAWQQRLGGAKACIRHWAQQPRNLPGQG